MWRSTQQVLRFLAPVWAERHITKLATYDGNDYSIPHTLVGKPLTLVASQEMVRILMVW
jgi:hypothetical protein